MNALHNNMLLYLNGYDILEYDIKIRVKIVISFKLYTKWIGRITTFDCPLGVSSIVFSKPEKANGRLHLSKLAILTNRRLVDYDNLSMILVKKETCC